MANDHEVNKYSKRDFFFSRSRFSLLSFPSTLFSSTANEQNKNMEKPTLAQEADRNPAATPMERGDGVDPLPVYEEPPMCSEFEEVPLS